MKKLMLGLMMAFAANIFAEPQPLGGTTTTWELKDNNTVLVIGGTGKMPDWMAGPISDRPWHVVGDAIESVVVGEGVTSVGVCAFKGFGSLTNVTLASTVTSIGDGAFFDCQSLMGVTIPSGVTSIGEYAFVDCQSLTGVTIPSGVTSIGDSAFGDCCLLTSVTMKGMEPPELGMSAFGYSSVGKIYVPAGSISAYEVGMGWENYKSNIVEAYIVALAPTAHGTLSVDKNAFPVDGFPRDATVTVTATPDEGYYLKSLVWNDGEDHDMTKAKQFTMPGIT